MLSKYVTITIHDTAFERAQNLPTNKDGVTIFKLFKSFTVIDYLQLSILFFNQITSLPPSTYNYVIPTINTKLTHLLLLAPTPTRVLENEEHIQYILPVQGLIKYMAAW